MIDIKTLTTEKLQELLQDKKTLTYIVMGALGVFILVYLFLAIIPSFSKLVKTGREIGGIKNNINMVQDRVERFDILEKQLEALNEEFTGYSKGLPGKKEIPQFLEDLSVMAQVSGVEILGITPSALAQTESGGEKKKYYQQMEIVITAKSGYHQLGHFISNLEGGERFVNIEALKIKEDKKAPREHNVKIVLRTYVAVENEKNEKK